MTIYSRYASRTGEVLGILDIPESLYDLHSTLLYPGEIDGSTQYMVDGVPIDKHQQQIVVDKTVITVAEGEVATLSGIPDGAAILITGPHGHDEITVDGGTLEFSAIMPGQYRLVINRFPYLTWETTIDAI